MQSLLTGAVVSLLFTLFLTPLFIRLFHRLQWGQFIRDDGPVSHHAKRGTATMGGVVFILAATVLAPKAPDPEKLSSYECGFNAFDDARMKFDVRFYLVSILFIIFDLEVAFLFPWATAFGAISMAAFWSMMIFLAVLTIGFAYEWKKGALEWQ